MMNEVNEMSVVREYTSRAPVDIVGLIRALGISYVETSMQHPSSGRIDIKSNQCTITVNVDETPQRRRFTAAHEVGHYLLHRNMIANGGHLDRLFGEAAKENPYKPFRPSHEVQANQFAADLLMPRSQIRSKYDNTQDNVTELAKLFDVSKRSMEIRLRSLGLRN